MKGGENMELKLGIMTNAELAEWFGIKEKSFTTNRSKKLEELSQFAEFENLKGKVKITKIIRPVFIKKRSRNYQIVQEGFKKHLAPNGLDTMKRISKVIYAENKAELTITEETLYRYLADYCVVAFGKHGKEAGEQGCRYYMLAKRNPDGGDNLYLPFTAEEQEIKQEILKRLFAEDKAEKLEQLMVFEDLLKTGEMNDEEAFKYFKDIIHLNTIYERFVVELEEALHCSIARVTLFVVKGD